MSHRKHRTTVVTFKEDLTKTTYHFNSKPDMARIYREARADDVTALIIFPSRMKEVGIFDTAPFDVTEGKRAVTFFDRIETPMILSVIHTVLGANSHD